MNKRLLSIILSESLIALAGRQVEAQSLAAQTLVPVPPTTLVPVTTDSYPLGAADHLNVPEDLSKVGYVEEEYFVSGTANVYDWAPPEAATVGVANADYWDQALRLVFQFLQLLGMVLKNARISAPISAT